MNTTSRADRHPVATEAPHDDRLARQIAAAVIAGSLSYSTAARRAGVRPSDVHRWVRDLRLGRVRMSEPSPGVMRPTA